MDLLHIINNIQNNNLAQCGTLTSQLGQTLNQQQEEICNNAKVSIPLQAQVL